MARLYDEWVRVHQSRFDHFSRRINEITRTVTVDIHRDDETIHTSLAIVGRCIWPLQVSFGVEQHLTASRNLVKKARLVQGSRARVC